jgi:hypothetical protein
MKPLTTIVATLALLMIGNTTSAQTQGFGGWNKIVQGITGDRTSNRSSSLPGISGLFGGLKSGSDSAPNLLEGLPNLIPNLNNPLNGVQNGFQNGGNLKTDFLSRMNQKSKDAIDRTTEWAQQKKQAMTSKMFSGALDLIKPNASQNSQPTHPLSGAMDWLKPKNTPSLNQPPIRSAENYGQQPSVRY